MPHDSFRLVIDRARLEEIVREAGRIAMAGWPGDGHTIEVWEKTPGDPVSAADLAVDRFLKAELGALVPEAGWLSEETVDAPARLEDRLVWLVDPIDGTRDYIRGRDGWAVSVALVKGSQSRVGLIHAPARSRDSGGEFWSAEAGKGAWCNGARMTASGRKDIRGARVPAQWMPDNDMDLVALDQPNSIALRVAMVAAGEADFVATLRWGFEWDIAAAGLIAQEAGAIVTDACGQALTFNKADPRAFGVLAASPGIHDAALAWLATFAERPDQ